MKALEPKLFGLTNSILSGTRAAHPFFRDFMSWVSQHLDVELVNVEFEKAGRRCESPTIFLVLARSADWYCVCGKDGKVKNHYVTFVRNTFAALAASHGIRLPCEPRNLCVVASCYALSVCHEATRRGLMSGKIELLQRLSCFNVYDVQAKPGGSYFVFYTSNNQLMAENKDQRQSIYRIYADYLKEFDTYGYLDVNAMPITFVNLEEFPLYRSSPRSAPFSR